MAYLKAHYQKYFYVNLLNSVISDATKTKEYMYEIKKYNIVILKPNIFTSDCCYKIIDDKILCPFNIIKGISKIVCNKIIENRDSFQDIYDFFAKTNTLTKANYEVLIQAGALDDFGYTRNTLISNLDSLLNYGSLCEDLDPSFVLKPVLNIVPEYNNSFLIEKEKELFGFYITNHPVLNYKLKEENIVNLEDMDKYFNQFANFIVMVEKTREIITKNNTKMMFFTGSDEERVADFTMFPKTYDLYFNLQKGDIIKVYGKVEKRNGSYQIIVSKIDKMM